jgi:DNA polymerase III alpha subunit (gram-positive type)
MKTNEFIQVDENSSAGQMLKNWFSSTALGRGWDNRFSRAWEQLASSGGDAEARQTAIATEKALAVAFSNWARKLQNSFSSDFPLIDVNAIPSQTIISGSSIGSQYKNAFSISESVNFKKMNYQKFDFLIENIINEQFTKVSPADWIKERLEQMTAGVSKSSTYNVMLNDLSLKFDAAIKNLYKNPNPKLNFVDDIYGKKAHAARQSSNFQQAISYPIRQIFDWFYDVMASQQQRSRNKRNNQGNQRTSTGQSTQQAQPTQQAQQAQPTQQAQQAQSAQQAQPAQSTSTQVVPVKQREPGTNIVPGSNYYVDQPPIKYPGGGSPRRPTKPIKE